MGYTRFTRHAATITSKPFSRAACDDICRPSHEKGEAEFRPLHMSWAAANGRHGNRRLQMGWRSN